jgi:signal peptidase I
MSIARSLKRFWEFLKKDTWQSWIVSIILVVVVIKFIFFPLMSLITGTSLPLVVVESCSMYHESDLESWWSQNAGWYESHNITKSEFLSFRFKNGLNKGDIIFVWGHSNYKKGDIIIFNPNAGSLSPYPIIHRIVLTSPIQTKGDHNSNQLTANNNPLKVDETNIDESQIIGKSVVKIPFLGWIKLILYEPFRDPSQRGFCH